MCLGTDERAILFSHFFLASRTNSGDSKRNNTRPFGIPTSARLAWVLWRYSLALLVERFCCPLRKSLPARLLRFSACKATDVQKPIEGKGVAARRLPPCSTRLAFPCSRRMASRTSLGSCRPGRFGARLFLAGCLMSGFGCCAFALLADFFLLLSRMPYTSSLKRGIPSASAP